MQTPISPLIHPEKPQLVKQADLSQLANFYDEDSRAVSFYFSLASTPDNSHREEVLMIKDLIRDIATKRDTEDGVTRDLGAIAVAAEELRQTPSRLKAIFACHHQNVWQAFDLPGFNSISRLDVGRHFHLAPLLQALEVCAPYCVVIVEHGKARGFVAQGTEIQEVGGRFKAEDTGLHVDDSRVGWSHHIDDDLHEHAKAYLKALAREIHLFAAAEHGGAGLVIGCREDLWSELEPQFSPAAKTAVIGRFLEPNLDVSPSEVLRAAQTIFENHLRKRYLDLLHKIKEDPPHSVTGFDEVLECLEEGRVQKLLLGRCSNDMVAECRKCGRLYAGVEDGCVFCGSTDVHAVLAEEALIRKALLTGAEILLPAPGASYGYEGVAAWLRY